MSMITNADTTKTDAERLETIVRDLVQCYELLCASAEERLEAMRRSDARALASRIAAENRVVQRLAELEAERSTLVSSMAERLGSEYGSATKITWIARRLKGQESERIASLCAHLKGLGARLKSTNEVARQAAEHLAQHMTGLLQTVSQHLNHAKTYSRSGGVDAGPRVVSSLDISS